MSLDDDASANEEFRRNEALEYRKPTLKPTGICMNCYVPCEGIYCSADCREDGEVRDKMAGNFYRRMG